MGFCYVHEHPKEVNFCPECGERVSSIPPGRTATTQKKKTIVLQAAVISIFIVAVVTVAVVVVFTRTDSRGSNTTAVGKPMDNEADDRVGRDNVRTDIDESDQNNMMEADAISDAAAAFEAYSEKVQKLAAKDSTLLFALIDIDGNDIPELVAECHGYNVSLFTWADGKLITLMDEWDYGAMGNYGYNYIPGHNVVHNYNLDQAGAVISETYLAINRYYELAALSGELRLCYFSDTNRNGIADENELFTEEPFYYFGDAEITEEEYDSYHIEGDYEWISGDKTAEEMLELLEVGM